MQRAAELDGVDADGRMAAGSLDDGSSEYLAELDVDLVGRVAAGVLPGEQQHPLGMAGEGVGLEPVVVVLRTIEGTAGEAAPVVGHNRVVLGQGLGDGGEDPGVAACPGIMSNAGPLPRVS